MQRLAGKVAVITGGTTGIGLAAAKCFASEGAKVTVTGKNPTTLEAARGELGPSVDVVESDATDVGQIQKLFERVAQRHDKVDVLFANAGGGGFRPLAAADEQYFDEVVALNLKSAYFAVQKATPFFRRGASVILNSSITAYRAYPATSVYAASKAGVRSLARTLGLELAALGVRVNVVSPGPIDTPLLDKLGVDPASRAFFEQSNPMKRIGTSDDVARLALFLASDESSYLNGIELPIDGGSGAF